MKTGIVMEGGAMRGIFTAGLLDLFMEKGVTFDGAVGISAGATFGCNLKSLQIGRTLRYNKKYCRDKRYASMESLIKTGDIFNVKFDYEEIPLVLDPFDAETFRNNPMEFWIGATNADTGEPVYYNCTYKDERDIDWIRASASMPGLSNPVYCHGKALTSAGPEKSHGSFEEKYREIDVEGIALSDGGTSDSIPVRFMEDLGYDKILVVCTQPKEYRKTKNYLLPVLKKRLKEYPELVETLRTRHLMYNATMDYLDRCEAERPDRYMVIRPAKKLGIHRIEHDPDQIQRVYDLGYAEGVRRLEEVREFLKG